MKRRIFSLFTCLILLYALAGYLSTRIRWLPDPIDVSIAEALEPGTERVLRGVASIHTEHSHDATGSLDDVARAARAAKLDFVLVGDHPPGPQPWKPAVYHDSVLIAHGLEVATEAGRGLLFGLARPLERSELSPEDLWRLFDDPDVTGVVVHGRSPRLREQWKLPETGAMHGWEVLDMSESARRALASPWSVYHAGSLLVSALWRSTPESLLRMERLGFDGPAVAGYDTLSMHGHLTAMAGLNHHPKTVSRGGRPFPGYEPFFETLVNHVILRDEHTDDAERLEGSIARAIRTGKVFISMGNAAEADAFRLGILDDAGEWTPMGGSVEWRPELRLVTSELTESGRDVLFRILRNGRPIGAYRGSALSFPIEGEGVYRVEVYRYRWSVRNLFFDLRPWIFSNPIRVEEPGVSAEFAASGRV